MLVFYNRLYSLNSEILFRYSFFYFYSFYSKNKKTMKNLNLKQSILQYNKKGKIYLIYSNNKTEIFSVSKQFSLINKEIKQCSLIYDKVIYNIKQKKWLDIKKNYVLWINFFNINKIMNFNFIYLYLLKQNYIFFLNSRKPILSILFSKRYNFSFFLK